MGSATTQESSTDTELLIRTEFDELRDAYYCIQPKCQLRKYGSFAILNKWFKQDWIALHPSEAVLLSLLDGKASLYQIGLTWAYIYSLPDTAGLEMAAACSQKFKKFIKRLDKPELTCQRLFNPREFIYNVKDRDAYEQAMRSHLTGEQFPIPIELSLNLTKFCNFKCEYCYAEVTSEALSTNLKDKKLDLDKMLSLLDEAAELGVIFLGITGGEPTAFPGWMNVVLRTLELNMIPVMTTNGSIITRTQLETLYAAGLQEITISLDAPTPDLHHHITRTNHTFDKVVTAIQNSIDIGIHTIVKCVATSTNYRQIPELVDLVAEMGAKECGVTYMEEGAKGSCATQINPQLDYNSLCELRQVVLERRKHYAGTCEVWPPKDPRQIHQSGFVPCGGMYSSIVINPSGGVNICDKLVSESDFIFGDTTTQALKEIWAGEGYRELREKALDRIVIDPICQECSKLLVCKTGCYIKSLIQTGNAFSKDPNCGGPYK